MSKHPVLKPMQTELERLRRDVTMLTKQLDAMFDTDIGELQTRIEELWAENMELRAENTRLKGQRW